ncbi:hypothetical protein BGZ95_011508 [Linnemannia exigua]|uniref:RNI-like protein n=1 Tax=Linnemannia exigua TaxID=604196 RepID=A0AAD4D9Z3_9FUNG|nr:hypothetical protein BGZ95_011508 [Linnemannia exigua]
MPHNQGASMINAAAPGTHTVIPEGFVPQSKTHRPFATLQNRTPTSTSSPEPDYEREEDVISTTNTLAKKLKLSNDLRQLVENANGTYDEDTQKISLTLTSSSNSSRFFEMLVKDGRELKELDVALAWDFDATDNENLVTRIYKTEITLLRMDLRGNWDDNRARKEGKLKYGNLHTLLWNKTLKGIVFENATYFGLRTDLPLKNKLYSNLRLLHFLVKIEPTSETQICTLVGACPNLLDLRLGTSHARGEMHPKMERIIGNLKKLKALHIYNTSYSTVIPEEDEASPRWKTIPQSDKPVKEIVRTGKSIQQPHLQELIGRSCGTLEVLMLQFPKNDGKFFELHTSASGHGSFSSSRPSTPKSVSYPTAQRFIGQPYARLTHLDLQVALSYESLPALRRVLPQLSLTHLGVDCASKDLLKFTKFETLESISLKGLSDTDLDGLRIASLKEGKSWKLNTIRLRNINNIQALQFLLSLPMKRVYLSEPSHESLKETLAHLDFSILEVLSIYTPEYDWSTEAILASQADSFNHRMKVDLGVPIGREQKNGVYDKKVRPLVGTEERLARERVEILPVFLQHGYYIQAILPPYSITKIERKRIAHYPDSVVEVITITQEPTPAASPASPNLIPFPTTKPRLLEDYFYKENISSKPEWPSDDFIENAVSELNVLNASTVSALNERDSSAISGLKGMDSNLTSERKVMNSNTTSESSGNSNTTNLISGVKSKYYVPLLHSFVQMVKAKGGTWDPELKKATITFKTEYVATNFFVKLLSQGTEVQDLDLTLEWDYQDLDLTRLVDQLALSNVQFLRLDLKDNNLETISNQEVLRSGPGKYQSLLGLFSNTKLEVISLVNASHIGSRTRGLCMYKNPSSQVVSPFSHTLQSFHFIGVIRATDDALLESIIDLCPRLVDVRLGSFSWASEYSPKLEGALKTLKELQALHLYNLSPNPLNKDDAIGRSSCSSELINPLKSIFSAGMHFGYHPLQDVVQQSLTTVEVLILRSRDKEGRPVQLVPLSSSNDLPFSRLTHLDLAVKITTDSHTQLAAILPGLNLTHFGAAAHTKNLVKSVNFASLKSIWLFDMDETYIQPLFDAFLGKTEPCKIDSMRFGRLRNIRHLPDFLRVVSLKRLYLSLLGHDALGEIFKTMELSELQVLAVFDDKYDCSSEATLAQRSHLFSEKMVLQLGYHSDTAKREVHNPKFRQVKPNFDRLSRQRVQIVSSHCMYENFMQSVLPGRSL